MLGQDVIKKKVFKDREFAEQSMMVQNNKDPNQSTATHRMRLSKVPLSYQESIGKRGVGVLVDECRRQIDEQNHQRSLSPYRVQDTSDISGGYASVSARNLVVPNSQSSPFL